MIIPRIAVNIFYCFYEFRSIGSKDYLNDMQSTNLLMTLFILYDLLYFHMDQLEELN